jgi:hypothetical protein
MVASFPSCCARGERPRCRSAAEQPDELAPPYSNTSSARASNSGGIVKPIDLSGLEIDGQIEPCRLRDG